MKGIDLLVEIATRDDLMETQSMWNRAVEDLVSHGTEGSNALARLLEEMLACRADAIGPVIAVAKKVGFTVELVAALESIEKATPLAASRPGARFRPQIAGGGKIGWTDGEAKRIRELAAAALKALGGTEPSR